MCIFFTPETSEILIDATKSVYKKWLVMLNPYSDDVARFMYQNRISMATLAGHGIGGKIALATSCYHYDKVTGYIGIDTSPMNHFYH